LNPHVYIDAIGVPRGCQMNLKSEIKLKQDLNLLFWWSTINKNINWINYIYYNQQRFVYYTTDAIKGIAQQLEPTSQMA
jgi:hypothetical protein